MAKTLLIVEDDTFLIKAYQAQFEGSAYTLLFATNGTEALSLVNTKPVDAVLLDLVMPHHSGIDFLRTLRADSNHNNIAVIVATNLSSPNQKEECEQLGISGYYIKSDVAITDIVATIRNVLEK